MDRPHPAPGSGARAAASRCDHVVASHAGRLVRASGWYRFVGELAEAVHFHHLARETVPGLPPPGVVQAHAFCLDCGAALDAGAVHVSTQEALLQAAEAAIGTGSEEPQGSKLNPARYVGWVAPQLRSGS
ncbi:hypothetical protein CLD22_14740 [Rubrivivax gelatinosus]|nr:hypothetical protein [Rubrivivax gelatinosus]